MFSNSCISFTAGVTETCRMCKAGVSAGSLAPSFEVGYAVPHHPGEDVFYISCRFFCIQWSCCRWGQVDWLPNEQGNVKFGGLSFWSPMQNTFGTKIDNMDS